MGVGSLDIHANLRQGLTSKFDLMRERSLAAVAQLSDADISWAPNEASTSVANLALHIRETVRHRVEAVLAGSEAVRDRDHEFESALVLTKAEAAAALVDSFDALARAVNALSDDDFLRQPFLDQPPAQSALHRESTILEILLQMLAHLSEHVGQIFYIAKIRLGERYVTTSIPKGRP